MRRALRRYGLAVPYEATANVVEAAGNLAGKIVVDITNPLTAEFPASP